MGTKPGRLNRRWALAPLLFSAVSLGDPNSPPPEIPPEFADAPAVVLEHAIDWNLWLHKSSLRVKKRVLIRRDSGSDQADQSVFYVRPDSELRDFVARTVQPDRSVIRVPDELQHDLTAYRSGDREVRVLLFTFPGARVGSILEWEYEIRFNESSNFEWWEVQEWIPVLNTDFEIRFHKFPDMPLKVGPQARVSLYKWCDKLAAKDGKTVVRRYTCKDVPAFEPEPLGPPEKESRLRLLMSWWPAQAPATNMTMWRRIGEQWQAKIRRLSKKDGDARQIVSRLREGVESEAELVDRIYAWVKDHLQVRDLSFEDDLEKGRGEAASVAEIIERGGGSPNEVAIVTLVLLRKAELTVRPVLVGDRLRERLDWHFPDPPSDLHVLLEVVTDGKVGFLDPGCDLCGPGVPDWRYCAGADSGIRIDLASGRVTAADIPPARPNLNQEHYRDEIRLEVDGLASVEGSVHWFGQHDVTVRRSWVELTPSGREDSLRVRIAGDIEGLEVHSSDPSDFLEPLMAEYSYERRDMALAVDKELLIAPPDVFTPNLALPMQEQRDLPIWWIYPYIIVQEAIFTLPEGFDVQELPPATQLTGPGLTFQGRWGEDADTARLQWEAILRYERILLEPEEYPKAKQFATNLFRALRRGIVARQRDMTATDAVP